MHYECPCLLVTLKSRYLPIFFEGDNNILIDKNKDVIIQVIDKLAELNTQSIMIEGGAKTIQSLGT